MIGYKRINTLMKKGLISVVFLTAAVLIVSRISAVEAAFLRFNPATVSAVSGNTFQIAVTVDSVSEEILSTDAYILFDSKTLSAQSVADGTYFPYVVHNIAPGKVSIRGLVTDAATSRTGSGTLATITFKVLTAGTANLSFFCDMNASDTSKIVKNDINASNIIVCTQNNTATVTAISPTPTGPANGTVTPTGTGGNGGNGSGGTSGGSNNAGTSGTGSNGSGGTGQGGAGSGGNASIGTGQNVDNNVTPSVLPRSGGLDNLKAIGIAGSALLILGGAASLLL